MSTRPGGRAHAPPLEALRAALPELISQALDVRLRRVVLFGSQASGRAHAMSDVDLAAFVELPPEHPWGAAERTAEHRRLFAFLHTGVQRAFGAGMKLDLNVRTIDQEAESREVLGTVEHLAATSGTVLYERAPERAPIVRRGRLQVIRDQATGWMEYAEHTLATAAGYAGPVESHTAAGRQARAVDTQARVVLSVRRACFAVCVRQQVPITPKYVPLSATIERMASAAPALATAVATIVDANRPSVDVGRCVLLEVIGYLRARDRGLARALAPTLARVHVGRVTHDVADGGGEIPPELL